jgi:hypothetical protein
MENTNQEQEENRYSLSDIFTLAYRYRRIIISTLISALIISSFFAYLWPTVKTRFLNLPELKTVEVIHQLPMISEEVRADQNVIFGRSMESRLLAYRKTVPVFDAGELKLLLQDGFNMNLEFKYLYDEHAVLLRYSSPDEDLALAYISYLQDLLNEEFIEYLTLYYEWRIDFLRNMADSMIGDIARDIVDQLEITGVSQESIIREVSNEVFSRAGTFSILLDGALDVEKSIGLHSSSVAQDIAPLIYTPGPKVKPVLLVAIILLLAVFGLFITIFTIEHIKTLHGAETISK